MKLPYLISLTAAMLLSAIPPTPAAKSWNAAPIQRKITEANWNTHPKVRAVRQTVAEIKAAMKRRDFKISKRTLDCGDFGLVVKQLASNARGLGRWYQDYREGQDASWDFYYYYDAAARLRFVLASAHSANGTREQLRIYFDETGKRIWQKRNLHGPGCPGCFSAYYDSDEALVFEPVKEFRNDGKCQIIKANK